MVMMRASDQCSTEDLESVGVGLSLLVSVQDSEIGKCLWIPAATVSESM